MKTPLNGNIRNHKGEFGVARIKSRRVDYKIMLQFYWQFVSEFSEVILIATNELAIKSQSIQNYDNRSVLYRRVTRAPNGNPSHAFIYTHYFHPPRIAVSTNGTAAAICVSAWNVSGLAPEHTIEAMLQLQAPHIRSVRTHKNITCTQYTSAGHHFWDRTSSELVRI